MRIVLFADDPDWHSRRLGAACTRHGATVTVESLRRCRFQLGAPGPGVVVGGLTGLPDIAIVRSIPKGSFEQVTFRLSLLHALRELGVRVINDARAIERCVDKSMTSFLLHHAGIPTPATLVTEDAAGAAPWREGEAGDVVVKPLFGAQGRGLQRLAPGTALPDPGDALDGVLYLQRYVGRHRDWRDFRVFVVGDQPVAAMMRTGASWITNVARGGTCERVRCAGRLAELAVAASRAVGAAYSGVDLIEDASGALAVLEVNSMPAWKGLQGVADIDIADAIARHAVTP